MNADPTPNTTATPDLTDPDAILQWIVLGLVRHLATVIGGGLLAHGLAASSDSQTVVGALVALGMMAWSAGEKYAKANTHQLALLAAAAGGKMTAEITAARQPAGDSPQSTVLSPQSPAAPTVAVPASATTNGLKAFAQPRLLAALALLTAFGCLAVAYLTGCASTPQQQAQFTAFVTAAKPIATAAIEAAAASQGVSPAETSAALTAANQLYGMAAQAWAGQPVSIGSALPSVATAVVPLLPKTTTGATAASILTAAAQAAEAQAATPTTP